MGYCEKCGEEADYTCDQCGRSLCGCCYGFPGNDACRDCITEDNKSTGRKGHRKSPTPRGVSGTPSTAITGLNNSPERLNHETDRT